MTFEGRDGSLLQFQTNGSVVMISKNNSYQVVFGDNNMVVTGAQNMTVNGGCAVKVEGDYDVTVAGSMRTNVAGNHDMTVAGNSTTLVAGDSESVVGGNNSSKVNGASEILAESMAVVARNGLTLGGRSVDAVSDGYFAVAAGADVILEAGGDTQVTTGSIEITSGDLMTNNGVNVGDTHTHTGVMSGSQLTDVPA